MEATEIWRRLTETFVRFFGAPGLALSRATTAHDVDGWDSLANVELMVELEQAFGIRFRTGEVADLENVGQLVDLIERHVGA